MEGANSSVPVGAAWRMAQDVDPQPFSLGWSCRSPCAESRFPLEARDCGRRSVCLLCALMGNATCCGCGDLPATCCRRGDLPLGVGLPMRGMLLDAEELDLWFNLDDHFKEDLKGRVTRFLQSALLGRFVTLLREVEEAPFIDRIRTVLQITDDFSTVHLLVLKQAVGLPMANILDVLAMHGDGKDLFPAGLTANLKSSEHDRPPCVPSAWICWSKLASAFEYIGPEIRGESTRHLAVAESIWARSLRKTVAISADSWVSRIWAPSAGLDTVGSGCPDVFRCGESHRWQRFSSRSEPFEAASGYMWSLAHLRTSDLISRLAPSRIRDGPLCLPNIFAAAPQCRCWGDARSADATQADSTRCLLGVASSACA